MQNDNGQQIQIKKLQPEHLEQYNDLLRYAFQVTEKELMETGWENDDIRQSKFPVLERANVLGAFVGDSLASQFAVYPLKMNIHGAVCDVGFVTSVATYPEYTGKGLMSKLMRQSLTDMRTQGQSMALLYPYSIPLYRHKGWEVISDKMSFHIKDTQLPDNIDVPGFVRRVDEDSPDLITLHNRFALKTHGCIFRNDLAWEEYWRWDSDDTEIAIYYDEMSEPRGYMVYLLKDDIMSIKEMVYIDMEAWKGLWKYIIAHDSMIEAVQGNNYSNEPISFWFEDSEIKETIWPYIMGRIIDVEQFLNQYRFRNIDRNDALTFVVSDPVLEWNNRNFTVRFGREGHPKIDDGVSDNMVGINIATLTAMLMGYKRPAYMQKIERIDVEPRVLAILENIIPLEKAHLSDYI